MNRLSRNGGIKKAGGHRKRKQREREALQQLLGEVVKVAAVAAKEVEVEAAEGEEMARSGVEVGAVRRRRRRLVRYCKSRCTYV